MATDFETGLLVGLLIGEGHFGGDGRQPQVTLRMNVRHAAMFHWIDRTFPGGRLYGPYHHSGRHYYQWMARGAFLRETLLPILEAGLSPVVDEESFERFQEMKLRYAMLVPGSVDPSPVAKRNPNREINGIFDQLRAERADDDSR